jgi:hypothetical protein
LFWLPDFLGAVLLGVALLGRVDVVAPVVGALRAPDRAEQEREAEARTRC